MSVNDLKITLEKVAQGADDLGDMLTQFVDKNAEDMAAAQKALDGTSTGTDGAVKSALDEAKTAIEEAKTAMADAAAAARNYAARV